MLTRKTLSCTSKLTFTDCVLVFQRSRYVFDNFWFFRRDDSGNNGNFGITIEGNNSSTKSDFRTHVFAYFLPYADISLF